MDKEKEDKRRARIKKRRMQRTGIRKRRIRRTRMKKRRTRIMMRRMTIKKGGY